MSKDNFSSKTAIVTGAGQGIGFEICRQLVMAGARVILNDADEKSANDAAKKINKEINDSCIAVSGDCSDMSIIKKMIDAAVRQSGKLDIAVANAGITLFGDF